MFGIQTSELVVIALVAILVFGPEKVPEFFHRAGQLISKLQRSADDLWTTLQTEMNQAKKPLDDLGKDLKTLGDTISRPLDAVVAPDTGEAEEAEEAEGTETAGETEE